MAKQKHQLSGPLMCWDIYMEAYGRMLQRGEDLQQVKKLSEVQGWKKASWNVENELVRLKKIVLITDASLIIRFASSNLQDMNGYLPDEVIGRTPKIFQGPQTEEEERIRLREAIQQRIPLQAVITNYRKDGSLYRCSVEEYPVWNVDGKLVNFIAFERAA